MLKVFKPSKRLITLLGVMIIGLTLSGCADGTGQASSNPKNITNSGEIIALSDTSHEWGDINIKGGDMKHTFALKNEGDEDLILKGASTSCMCTKARYRLPDNSISPSYGMHNNPTSWTASIKPGETFDMEVVFDPMAHGPNATGPINRSINLVTSSKTNPTLELKVSGNVLSKKDYKSKVTSMPL